MLRRLVPTLFLALAASTSFTAVASAADKEASGRFVYSDDDDNEAYIQGVSGQFNLTSKWRSSSNGAEWTIKKRVGGKNCSITMYSKFYMEDGAVPTPVNGRLTTSFANYSVTGSGTGLTKTLPAEDAIVQLPLATTPMTWYTQKTTAYTQGGIAVATIPYVGEETLINLSPDGMTSAILKTTVSRDRKSACRSWSNKTGATAINYASKTFAMRQDMALDVPGPDEPITPEEEIGQVPQ